MRTLKELYQVVYDNFYDCPRYALCSKINSLLYFGKITLDESLILKEHFKKQRPNYSIWWWKRNNADFPKDYQTPKEKYWWTNDLEGDKIRVKFLQYLINKL